MDKKYRYSFWKVCFWVVLLNVIFAVFILTILFNVRQPYQTINIRAFSVPHYIGHIAAGTVFQVFFYYLALNWYYRLLARSASWKSYLPPVLVIGANYIIFYFIYDLATRADEVKISIDLSMKIFSYGL